ncbi:EAL domain-containing protein [Arenimonas sp.]|uniref:bifunctional diguanylate cyclase/phosphodiesterase n=1 Tax=Arenimonas sp. TaxID=1872635 RepID=UPI0025BD7CCC|nr:EAL domain-containing protein [Arenimonas sp.]
MADSPPGRDRADRRNVGAVLASAGKTAFEILQADSVQRAAEALVSALAETGRTGTCVAWTEAQGLAFHPRQPDRTDQASWLLSTLALPGNTGPRVLCDDAVDAAAFLLDLDQVRLPPLTPAQEYLVALAERRIRELFAVERLSASVHRLAEAEKLQRALFTIADIAGSGHDMPSMLKRLHETIGQLMYAENFYIALLDESGENLQFPYFVDTMDSLPQASEPMASIAGGLTWYVLRDGVPLMGTIDQLRQQVSGPLDVIGASSEDWLGVPMLRDGKSVGALVVQSYLPGVGYTEADLAVLTFVADHVLTALERKRDQAELEQRVAIRTRQLAEANQDLELRIAERERARHLQETLYRIARLTHGEDDDDGFYQQIHGAVAELINAENFYIALLSEDGTMLHFPYHRDQAGGIPTSRPVGRGLTEHVIRLGEALLTDETGVRQLVADGVLEHNLAMSTPAMCWLGVPLADGERVMGAVVVQSYRSDLRYEHEDAELLKFVSYQIATSLQRRNHAESLRRLNAELESRVQSRTHELREQIAVREQVEERLKHQVMHDPLTGLPNRVYLRDRIERAIAARLRDPGRGFALMYLDVDRFKLFNDSLGHLAGDEVLREVARRLGQSVRDPDVVARLSGDEFAILIEDGHLPQTACKVAQRILNTLQHPMTIAGRELQASASIGIAIGADTHRNTDELLHDADVALYRAKEAGRQRFVLFDESLQKSAMDVLEIEHQVRAGLAHGEFIPYFQPIVRLADGATVGYEALARWRHPQRGVLGPGEFMAVAEDSGLIEPLDWQIYRASCEAGAALVPEGGYLTINLSARHFQSDQFDARMLALLSETGFDPRQLRIEVTEGTLLGDTAAVVRILERLRAGGVMVALDDFGTGYSSLGYVHRFPLDMIKIDRSFIAPLGDSVAERSSAIIGAVLALAQSLKLDVVAEGVETAAQRDALVAMGCTHGQGYWFGRPQALEHWLRAGSPGDT